MIAQRIWALIDEGIVKNTIISEDYSTANSIAKNTINTNAFAVEITQTPTAVGHTYENGGFKNKEGKEVKPLPTAEEEVKRLKSENKSLRETVDQLVVDNLGGSL